MQQASVVTGASYGIGEAIARVLLSKGYKVYGISRTTPNIKHSSFIWLQCDLTKESNLISITKKIPEKYIHLLVNNAGTAISENVLKYNDKHFKKIFGLNFISPIKLTLALLPKLGNGIVINISSLADRFPSGLYGSSKAALNNYFETIAYQLPNLKILSVLPSYVDTPLLRKLNNKNPNFDRSQINTPDKIANFIAFVLDHPTSLESGTRVIVIPKYSFYNNFDPEKLWVFTTSDNKLKKIKINWIQKVKGVVFKVPFARLLFRA